MTAPTSATPSTSPSTNHVAADRSAQPTLHHQTVRGLDLAYWQWRPECRGQGPTLLFTHATGFHGRVWDEVIRRLPGRHVIALEQRGHGRSASAPFAGWEDFGRDLAGFAQALGLQGVLGIGHSMGGQGSVQAAAFAPGCFARLLLIDPVLQSPERYHLPPLPAHLLPPAANRKNRFDSPEAMLARYGDRLPYSLFDRQCLADYVHHGLVPAADGDGWQLACAPEFEAAVYAAGRLNMGVYASVRALHIPVLVVRAQSPDPAATAFNPLASPTWAGLAGEFRQGRDLHLAHLSHLMPMEDPARIAAIVAEELAAMG